LTTRIVIVDDSSTARLALRRALETDASMRVVGEASNRERALELVASLKPQLVTMDVYLDREDGIEVTAALMQLSPVPILIVTGRNPSDPELVYEAMQAGALEVFGKLPAAHDPGYETQRQRLVRLVKALARVPVVRRRRQGTPPPRLEMPLPRECRGPDGLDIALIGASTGGPPLLGRILQQIAAPAPVPIVIVQHMAVGFGEGFADWLAETSGHRTVIVSSDRVIVPGAIYLAPTGRHLVLRERRVVALSDEPPRWYQRPSVDVLFESAAEVVGTNAVAVLLTGMGRDGAAGLAALRRAGAYTVAQAPATCTVASMPAAAIAAGAADAVVTPDDLATWLSRVFATASARSVRAP
jgi:two-component system chemotaxis response regulator CheB